MPVALLHGAMRGPKGMLPTARALEGAGFRARAFGYATRRRDLAGHAESLEAELRAWLGSEGPEAIGLLTHSMGGLVARALLDRPSFRAWAPRQRMVMLAPPNQGSSLAQQLHDFPPFHWVYGRAAAELQPGPIARLAPPPDSCATLILVGGRGDPRGYNPLIAGDDDGVVATADTPLPGVSSEFVGGLHSTLQWRKDVLDRAARFLGASEAG